MEPHALYATIVDTIKTNPDVIHEVQLRDLQPVALLNLLDESQKAVVIARLRKVLVFASRLDKSHVVSSDPKVLQDFVGLCDAVYYGVLSRSTVEDQDLQEICTLYNSVVETLQTVPDMLYDYAKHVAHSRKFGTNERAVTMQSTDPTTGTGARRQVKGTRDATLPLALKSLDNVLCGTGDLDKWLAKHAAEATTFSITSKLDGISALWYRGTALYTRGNAEVGTDITAQAQLLKTPLPPVNGYSVRGELIMRSRTFDEQFKGKPSKKGGKTVRTIVRNSVYGALKRGTDTDFLGETEFIAYELILHDDSQEDGISKLQPSPSVQHDMLKRDGFRVVRSKTLPRSRVTEAELSKELKVTNATYAFRVDGLVVKIDDSYERSNSTTKNPSYARAFKEHIESDTAVTTIQRVEWNVTRTWKMQPVYVFDTVDIHGVQIDRATAHNARRVMELGLGPGAKVEVIHNMAVNPQINKVLSPCPDATGTGLFPGKEGVDWEWIPHPRNEKVSIQVPEGQRQQQRGAVSGQTARAITFSLRELGVKNVAEGLVQRILDSSSVNVATLDDFLNMTPEQLAFLGPRRGSQIVNEISACFAACTDVGTLMSASRCFEEGIGKRRFQMILKACRDLFLVPYEEFRKKLRDNANVRKRVLEVKGIGVVIGDKFVNGLESFVEEFIGTTVGKERWDRIIISESESSSAPPADDLFVCFTGFRDAVLQEQLETRRNATIQSSVNKKTNYVIVASKSYRNKKTQRANELNIPIVTPDEAYAQLLDTYLSNSS